MRDFDVSGDNKRQEQNVQLHWIELNWVGMKWMKHERRQCIVQAFGLKAKALPNQTQQAISQAAAAVSQYFFFK